MTNTKSSLFLFSAEHNGISIMTAVAWYFVVGNLAALCEDYLLWTEVIISSITAVDNFDY